MKIKAVWCETTRPGAIRVLCPQVLVSELLAGMAELGQTFREIVPRVTACQADNAPQLTPIKATPVKAD